MNKPFKTSIVVQIFVKNHILQSLIDKLLCLDNIDNYNVIFWQDSLIGSKFYDNNVYNENHSNCENIIKENLSKFKSAEFKQNEMNRGTTQTCKISMDYAFTKSDYAILLEDDIIVSKNFLHFFEFFINNNYISIASKNLCIAGESIFFDAQYREVTDEHIKIASNLINDYNLFSYYFPLSFVPSSCFCTSAEIWELIGPIRGLPTGCNKLNDYIKDNGYFTISPVVPVCKDIGMTDSIGYSNILRSKKATDAPYEYKNVYILNENNNKIYSLLPLNKDKLYDIVSNLNTKTSLM